MGQINFPHAAADILRRRPIPWNHLIVAMHAEKDERNVIEITFAEFEMNIFRHARIDYRWGKIFQFHSIAPSSLTLLVHRHPPLPAQLRDDA